MTSTIERMELASQSTHNAASRHAKRAPYIAQTIGFASAAAAVAVSGAGTWAVLHPEDSFRLVFPLLTRWAARHALPGRSRSSVDPACARFTGADAERVVARAWEHFDAREHSIPAQPTVGSQLVLRLACWTAGLFHSLRDDGIEGDDAVELTADVMWQVFQLEGRFGQILTRIRPELKTHARRRLPDGTIDLGFPFGPPAYEARPVTSDGVRSFEVVRCPAAAYFRTHGLADLGQAALCDMDYALSEMQGIKLERKCTLMAGDDHCDFCWPDPARSGPAHDAAKEVRIEQ